MKLLTMTVLGAAVLAAPALAQTAPRPVAPSTTVPAAPGASPSTGVPPGTGVVDRNTGTAAASGDRNQAVTTTNADAAMPARGSSSFTEAQAQGRIEEKGFTGVTGLAKDDDGVWRGTAQKGGAATQVWLDYKGSIGAGNARPASAAR